jgi:hypothetical protein
MPVVLIFCQVFMAWISARKPGNGFGGDKDDNENANGNESESD